MPKILLFTDKAETPALFAALAVNLRNRSLLFGDVHSSQAEAMQQFSVSKVNMLHTGCSTLCKHASSQRVVRVVTWPSAVLHAVLSMRVLLQHLAGKSCTIDMYSRGLGFSSCSPRMYCADQCTASCRPPMPDLAYGACCGISCISRVSYRSCAHLLCVYICPALSFLLA